MNKKSLFFVFIGVLIALVIFTGCPTGTGKPEEAGSGEPSEPTSPSSTGGGPAAAPETPVDKSKVYVLKGITDSGLPLVSAGLTVKSALQNSGGTTTIKVEGNAVTGIPKGAEELDYFKVESFNITEASKLRYAVITIDGFTGGDGTIIKQTNNSFILFKDMPGYNRSNGHDVPIWLTNGTHVREKTYAKLLDSFDFTFLLAEGKGPITLEVTPKGITADKYTVVLDYSAVEFRDESPVADTAIQDVKPVLPDTTNSGLQKGNPTGLDIASVTQGKSTGIYRVSLKSPSSVGSTSVAALKGDVSDAAVEDFLGTTPNAASRWPTELLVKKVTIATLDLKLKDYSSGAITIKQENPGFALYEAYYKKNTTPVWDARSFCYTGTDEDGSLRWDKKADEGGRILYKEKSYTDETGYGKSLFGGLDFILWGGAPVKVVTFIIKYPTSNGEVTKIIQVDYSGVQF
jgi:hypothetical protein